MGHLRFAAHLTTGTATGVAPAGQVNGSALFLGNKHSKRNEHASAVVTVDAETDTITLAAKWQASNDSSTWFDIASSPQNAAAVVLATGTSGADAAVAKAVPLHEAAYGYKFARLSVVVGVVTGTDSDTFSIAYSYRDLDPGQRPNTHLVFAGHIITGTATGVAPGGQVNGRTLFMGGIEQKVEHLSALVTVDGETNTITIAPKWQGSADGSTWIDLGYGPQNPAVVPLVTGTAGGDAAVTRVVVPPPSVYGYKFARCALAVGVVTGTDNDTFSIAYSYRQIDSGGNAAGGVKA